jgi:hypothetical protein
LAEARYSTSVAGAAGSAGLQPHRLVVSGLDASEQMIEMV